MTRLAQAAAVAVMLIVVYGMFSYVTWSAYERTHRYEVYLR